MTPWQVGCVGLAAVAYQCMAPRPPHVRSSAPPPQASSAPPVPRRYVGCRVSCPNGGYRVLGTVEPAECQARQGSGVCTYTLVYKGDP